MAFIFVSPVGLQISVRHQLRVSHDLPYWRKQNHAPLGFVFMERHQQRENLVFSALEDSWEMLWLDSAKDLTLNKTVWMGQHWVYKDYSLLFWSLARTRWWEQLEWRNLAKKAAIVVSLRTSRVTSIRSPAVPCNVVLVVVSCIINRCSLWQPYCMGYECHVPSCG